MIITDYGKFINENKTEFDFKSLFLALTEYTVPAGYEDTLEPILRKYIPNLKRDSIGNFYTQIGNSKTLFTSHLDTFSKRRKKVKHVFDGNMIKTDGNSVLGGDNKNGVTILLYLISQNIPGTYFFFIGEESIVNKVGCYGSTNALKDNPDFFSQFDKAVAFDRRGKGSFVKRQAGRNCASDEFANAVIEEFGKNGLEFGKDNAYRTDSAIFMDVIPEITNISSGGEYEHTYMESTDIDYLEKVAIAASNIDWDNLPIIRKPSPVPKEISEEIERIENISKQSENVFNKVSKLMGAKGFICVNKNDFQPGIAMIFDKFLEELPVKLTFNGDIIKCIDGHKRIGKFREGDFNEFKRRQRLKVKNFSRGIWLETSKKMNEDGYMSIGEFIEILNSYDITIDEFKEYMKTVEENQFLNIYDDHIEMDIRILHHGLKKKQKEQEKVLAEKENEKLKKEEIENILNKTGLNYVENVNKTRLEKFIGEKDFGRFVALNNFDKSNGSWDENHDSDDILDLLKYNFNYIFDRKYGVFYEI